MTWAQLLSSLFNSAYENRIPFTGTFELTPRCNLSCRMCYINLPVADSSVIEREFSAQEWIRIAQEAKQAGLLRLLLTGGEIFVRKDIREIYETLSQMGFLIQIFTNGTLITPEIAKWLGKIPPSQIGVTLYGGSPEVYEQVCGSKKAYDSAIRGIDALVSEGIKPQIRMTIIKKNIQDFDKLLAFADDRGLLFAKNNLISRRRDGLQDWAEKERLTPEMILEFNKSHQLIVKKDPSEVAKEKEHDEQEKDKQQTSKKAVFCGGGYDSFWINWYGRMTFCGDIETPYSLPFQDGFTKAWEELQQIVDRVPFCKECLDCKLEKHCVQCPGRLMNEIGTFEKPGPFFCRYAELLVNEIESPD